MAAMWEAARQLEDLGPGFWTRWPDWELDLLCTFLVCVVVNLRQSSAVGELFWSPNFGGSNLLLDQMTHPAS